ncbi:MAG: arabinose isomerase [Cyclobacteriaceae bacterium]|nr:arabinose isomerase [Cyclobacteriaceae bacterium]MDH5249986.1 arabinose isomerase [Cyclobacteriaceae bacterium]
MERTYKLKVGLFGIGLQAYWGQFEGLEQRLHGYVNVVGEKLSAFGSEVVNLGLIDTPQKALAAGHKLRQADVDLVFLYVTTYALSATVLPVVKRAKVPVIVLNLSPDAAIDYDAFNRMPDRTKMTAEWLAFCSACTVPEIASVFRRSGIPFYQVTGRLHDDPIVWKEVGEWVEAARVVHALYHNRLGLMGNYYGGMLDIYTNLTLQCATFGGHIEIIEVDELTAIRKNVSPEQIAERVRHFKTVFDILPDCDPTELERAGRTSIALDILVEKYALGSLAYYHKGSGTENEDTMSSIILGASLVTARGIPAAGEYEVKNAQAMKIMDCFGAGGSFTEYYAMDYTDDVILMGHDGPGHIAIAAGKTKVRPLQVYHGKVGRGLSVEMSVRHGAVTLLSVVEETNGTISLLCAEGECVEGPILQIGNTNSRYKFSTGARKFVEAWNSQGPAHHCAVGVGHVAAKIEKVGMLLGIKVNKIC